MKKTPFLTVVIAAVALWPTVSPAANITLTLGSPEYCDCGWVSVNGGVSSDERLFGMVWDWGDGSRTLGWFPGSHHYEDDGTYELVVTAVDCSATELDTVMVTITTSSGMGCPSEASPPCSYPCYELVPSNMHLIESETSAEPLELRTGWGDTATGTLAFTPDDPSLVSIAGDGYVTGLRTESDIEIGTRVQATVDGRFASNVSVMRVLQTDYDVPFAEELGANTSLYYPVSIEGEDIAALVEQYEIAAVNEYAYDIQMELLASYPFGGCRQLFEVDFGHAETSRVCGISGNPIRLGWNIEGNDWQNCFLVPFMAPRSPQWFVFYHELGHNTTWASTIFAETLWPHVYSEGLASILSGVVMDEVLRNPWRFPAGEAATASMEMIHQQETSRYETAFDDWLLAGAPFGSLDPDIVDGLWLQHAGENIRGFASRFFLPLEPVHVERLNSVLCEIDTENESHTFFAALVSAAQGEDLSQLFLNSYHYPLDQTLFDSAYAAIVDILQEEAGGRVPALTIVKVEGTEDLILSWDPSCLASNVDYAVYEGSLGSFYSHVPLHCSTAAATLKTVTPSAGDTYYLVAPSSQWRTGSYGVDHEGRERPASSAACSPQAIGLCESGGAY